MKRVYIATGVGAFLFLEGPAFAQADQGKTQKQSDPNEIVCQKQEVTGSRLTVKKVCKTRAQWADLLLQDRQEIERVQTQRGMQGQ
jgi:hypothetical protein